MTDVIDKYADGSLPGAVTRANPVIAERIMDSVNPVTSFGLPCKVVSNEIEMIESGDAATDFYGILSRLAPSKTAGIEDTFLSGTPNADYPQAVLVKRYIAVKCVIGTPTINGPVYMAVLVTGGHVIGDLEATADGANNVLLPGVTWSVAGKDGNDVSEIFIA